MHGLNWESIGRFYPAYLFSKSANSIIKSSFILHFGEMILKSAENICEQWDITETNNWTRLVIFDAKN